MWTGRKETFNCPAPPLFPKRVRMNLSPKADPVYRPHLEVLCKFAPVTIRGALRHCLAGKGAVLVAQHDHVGIGVDGVGEKVSLQALGQASGSNPK